MPRTLHDFTPTALEALAVELGEPSYRARQLALGLYQRRIASMEELTDLPKELRERLAAEYGLCQPKVVEQSASEDGTTKYLMEFGDHSRVEAVYLPRGEDDQK